MAKEHGYHIRRFSSRMVDRTILTTLAQHCHFLEELDLGFVDKTFWMQYEFLEQVFIALSQTYFKQQEQQQRKKLQEQQGPDLENGLEMDCEQGRRLQRTGLRKAEISLNLLDLKPSMLWSLCQLPHLTDLTINAIGTIGDDKSLGFMEDMTLSLLECCPRVESLTLRYSALRVLRHPFRCRVWIKDKLEKKRSRGPSTPQEAIDRCGISLPVQERTLSGKATTTGVVVDRGTRHGLRRLVLSGYSTEVRILPRLFSRCNLLEEFGVHLGWARLDNSYWRSLSTSCRNIKAIDISGYSYHYIDYDILSIPDILVMFPKLETLNAQDYPRQDLSVLSLDHVLQKYAQEHGGEGHPLKSFSLVGHFDASLSKLLEVLACRSFFQLESLKIGYALGHPAYQAWRQTPHDSPEGSSCDFSRSWDAVARTLVKLDLHGVYFPDKTTMATFFGRLQEFGSLRVLRVSRHHVKDLISISTYATTLSSVTYAAPTLANDTPPVINYCFPHIQHLIIALQWFGGSNAHPPTELIPSPNAMLTQDEVLFILTATPSLVALSLTYSSISKETATFIRQRFRHVRLDTTHDMFPL
ncbi:hypothetical protein BGX24_012376 [Mortierella sp. AD032]|nr:hypothetical protein BGX24_012376 [Mortierella sp. AD032]